jgi:predicted nucleic acid-binding protein
MNKELFVLDSCALIAFFREEEGAKLIAKIFENSTEERSVVYIHKTTIAEVYYDTLRFAGKEEADRILKVLATLPISPAALFDNNFIKRIGYFKVHYKVSFADCFVLALAAVKGAMVVSSDHHEFDEIDKSGVLSFKWIR